MPTVCDILKKHEELFASIDRRLAAIGVFDASGNAHLRGSHWEVSDAQVAVWTEGTDRPFGWTQGTWARLCAGKIEARGTAFDFRSSDTGARILIDGSGLELYSSGEKTVDLNAADGSASFKGTITAGAGVIAGWNISANKFSKNDAELDSAGKLKLGTGTDIITLDAQDASYRLWIGAVAGVDAPFRVTKGGQFTASGVDVGGTFAGTLTDLTVTGTLSLSGSGKLITAASPNARVELTTTLLAGYSDATTKEFWLDATTGKGYFAGGTAVMSADGIVLSDQLDITFLTAIEGGTKSGLEAYVKANPTGASTATLRGVRGYTISSVDCAQNLGTLIGAQGTAYHYGSGTLGTLIGVIGTVSQHGAGTISNMYGGYTSSFLREDDGDVTNLFGQHAGIILEANCGDVDDTLYLFHGTMSWDGSSGSVLNCIGLYLPTLYGTNKWGVKQMGTADKNWFAGPIHLGDDNIYIKKSGNDMVFCDVTNGTERRLIEFMSYVDRNPTDVSLHWEAAVANHAQVERASYTVPGGKKAVVLGCMTWNDLIANAGMCSIIFGVTGGNLWTHAFDTNTSQVDVAQSKICMIYLTAGMTVSISSYKAATSTETMRTWAIIYQFDA